MTGVAVARDTLGNVEVRWVDPVSGTSLTQSAPVSGRTDAPFDAGDRHLRFGSIVALSSDRYSALSPQVENASVDYGGIYEDLAALQAELDSLEDRLGSTQAFRDFSFLLDQLDCASGRSCRRIQATASRGNPRTLTGCNSAMPAAADGTPPPAAVGARMGVRVG